MAWVKDVDKDKDREEYLRVKKQVQTRYAMEHPPPVSSLMDLQKVIEHRERFGVPSFITCKDKTCEIKRVNRIEFYRDRGEARMEINYGYGEESYYLQLKNVLEVTTDHPSTANDVVWSRFYGSTTEYHPYHSYEYFGSMGKCYIREDRRGMYNETPELEKVLKDIPENQKPPKTLIRVKGLEIYCSWPKFDEYYIEKKDYWIKRAKHELPSASEEEIIEKSFEIAEKNYKMDKGCVD